jgi:hypothetical protein
VRSRHAGGCWNETNPRTASAVGEANARSRPGTARLMGTAGGVRPTQRRKTRGKRLGAVVVATAAAHGPKGRERFAAVVARSAVVHRADQRQRLGVVVVGTATGTRPASVQGRVHQGRVPAALVLSPKRREQAGHNQDHRTHGNADTVCLALTKT